MQPIFCNMFKIYAWLMWINPATFLCLFQVKTGISINICLGLFCIHKFETRGGCLFRRYCWNCWPSLFKLLFSQYDLPGVLVCSSCLKLTTNLSPSDKGKHWSGNKALVILAVLFKVTCTCLSNSAVSLW
jgi:hypothetical protein